MTALTPEAVGAWFPISTAPMDGSVFIARNADHLSFGSWVMLRRVRHVLTEGEFRCIDLGAWLHVVPIEPDYEHGSDTPERTQIPFALAADDLNRSVHYEWQPLPGITLLSRDPAP